MRFRPSPPVLAIFLVAVLSLPLLQAGSPKVDVSKIHGRIQIVDSFPDYRVQVVTAFPDLRVQKVDSFPDRPGRWQMVDSFPDFKIQFVTSFPDFKIQFVNSFPGPAGSRDKKRQDGRR